MFRHKYFVNALALSTLLAAACENPRQGFVYLTRAGDGTTGSAEESLAYYAAMRDFPPEPTLELWKQSRCFQPNSKLNAFYYNNSDLGLGREMRCAECLDGPRKGLISCVVSNHGVPQILDLVDPQFGKDRATSINASLSALEKFLADTAQGLPATRGASVAMDFANDREDKVRFYIYDATEPTLLSPGSPGPDSLIPGLQLDGEGGAFNQGIKFMRNCLACHGGRYDEAKNKIIGSQFLDFDVGLFVFSEDKIASVAKPKFAVRTSNEENLRELNVLVRKVESQQLMDPEIVNRIDGSYSKGVNTPNSVFDTVYVPKGWPATTVVRQFQGKPITADVFFRKVVHPYCAMCHFSQIPGNSFSGETPPVTFAEASQWFNSTIKLRGVARNSLELIKEEVCGAADMPHSEVTRANLKRDSEAVALICN